MRLLISFVLLFQFFTVFCQQEFGLEVVKELCSEKYHGRGYVNDGHIKAASYIAKHFESLGLKKLDDSYFQKFNINVNTFPGNMSLEINGKPLIPGKDFIIKPSAGGGLGEYTPVRINRSNVSLFYQDLREGKTSFDNKIFILDKKNIEDKDSLAFIDMLGSLIITKAPVIEIKQSKFTWSVGRTALNYPIFEVQDSILPEKINRVKINVESKFIEDLQTQNVIGYIPGKKKKKFLIVSAHYDHLGRMGKATYFPGANDNASGMAMLLYLSNYFSKNKPKYSIAFMAFGAEEVGILGSKYYVENPLIPLKKTKFVINCDIMGTGDEGITVVNGTVYEKEFKRLTSINADKQYLKKIKIRGRAANSDHYWFSQRQVPAIFIYTMGGITAYHDIYDKSETLPLSEFNNLSQLLQDFINSF